MCQVHVINAFCAVLAMFLGSSFAIFCSQSYVGNRPTFSAALSGQNSCATAPSNAPLLSRLSVQLESIVLISANALLICLA